MTEGRFNFKSNVGAIDIDFSDNEYLHKYKNIEGSDGSVFKECDIIDSGMVNWSLGLETKEYGIKSFIINITNVRVSLKDINENVLDLNFNCDEYDINSYIETNTDCFYPRTIYVNLKSKRLEVTF